MASVLKVDKLDPQSGTALEIGTSGDTITVPSGATFAVSGTMNASSITAGTLAIAQGGTGAATFAAAGLSNTPAWDARASTNQTGLSSGGWTKIEFDTEVFDTDSAYDTTNDKFVVPAGAAGKYFITTFAKINNAGSTYTLQGTGMRITVNGANRKQSIIFAKNTVPTMWAEGKGVSCVLALDASDEVEVYAYYQDTTSATGSITGGTDYDTFFTGYKLIG
jgi:hypothetical protein